MNTQRFIELIEDAGYDARSYTGRGYRSACVGVELFGHDVFKFAIALSRHVYEDKSEEELRFLGDLVPRTDSMGLGIILYFPSMTWVESDLVAADVREEAHETHLDGRRDSEY